MTERPWCEKRIFGSGRRWGGEQCGNRAKGQYNGKWLCGVHSPEAEARREAKREENYQEHVRQSNRRGERHNYMAACVRAFHDPAGRKIATEDIGEGVVFQLRDALNQMQNWACKFKNMLEYESLKDEKQFGKENGEARALLSSLKVQGPET